MAEPEDRVDFCRQALAELGTRSTIVSFSDGSQEAFYCNLLFEATRDQVLRAAHWGFAGRTDVGILWKALPGTPENPTVPPGYMWSDRDPAPPWLYSYVYPGGNTVQVRRVRARPQPQDVELLLPYYAGGTFINHAQSTSAVPFEVANDSFNAAGNPLSLTKRIDIVTVVTGGSGYRPGDYITLTGGGGVAGNAAVVVVQRADPSGIVQQVFRTGVGGSYSVPATGTMTQLDTTGQGTGFSCTATFADHAFSLKILLTNARNLLIDFTTSLVNVADYDPGFGDAFMLALEGKLALALLGDRALYGGKLQEANAAIIEARVRDGNEGLTTYDFVPDWMQARGIASGAALNAWLPQYGPLFAV